MNTNGYPNVMEYVWQNKVAIARACANGGKVPAIKKLREMFDINGNAIVYDKPWDQFNNFAYVSPEPPSHLGLAHAKMFVDYAYMDSGGQTSSYIGRNDL